MSPVFAFENDATSHATWTFLDNNGTVLHTFLTAPTDGTFDPLSNLYNYVGASTAILARSNGITPETTWSVIHSDGTVSPVASALTSLLNQISASNFPGTFLVDPSTLYAVEQFPNPRNPFKFYELNLTTGAILESDSLTPLSSSSNVLFEPENIDSQTHLISFLISNTTFDNVKIPALSAVTLALDTNAVSVHPLSGQIAKDILSSSPAIPQYQTTAFLSGDGSLLVYQSLPALTTYVLNLTTGRTITLATALKPFFVEGQESVYFSPTDQWAALLGGGSSGTNALFIVDTATGALVADIAAHFPGDPSLAPADWADPTHFIFTTNSSTYAATQITHLYDLRSGQVTTFASELGPFVAVLP